MSEMTEAEVVPAEAASAEAAPGPDEFDQLKSAAELPDGYSPPDWQKPFLQTDIGKEHAKMFQNMPKPEALLKSYLEWQKAARVKGELQVPGEGASDEERAEFDRKLRAATGVPESPEGYRFERPESLPEEMWDAAGAAEFAKFAHEKGIPPKVAADLVAYDAARSQKWAEEQKAAYASEAQALRKEWGEQFGERLDRAKAVAARLGFPVDRPLTSVESARLLEMNAHFFLGDDTSGTAGHGAGSNPLSEAESIAMGGHVLSDDYSGKNGPHRQAQAQRVMESKLKEAARLGLIK